MKCVTYSIVIGTNVSSYAQINQYLSVSHGYVYKRFRTRTYSIDSMGVRVRAYTYPLQCRAIRYQSIYVYRETHKHFIRVIHLDFKYVVWILSESTLSAPRAISNLDESSQQILYMGLCIYSSFIFIHFIICEGFHFRLLLIFFDTFSPCTIIQMYILFFRNKLLTTFISLEKDINCILFLKSKFRIFF